MRFNADELYRMAIALERNGQRFYRQAAGRFADPRLRGILLMLAEMEVKHEEFFAALRARSAAVAATPAHAGADAVGVDADNENAEYLQALVDASVFVEDGKVAGGPDAEANIYDVLRFALGREKETVVFYLTMKTMVSPWAGGADLDAIVAEEVRHVQLITAELRRLERETQVESTEGRR